MGEPTLFSLTGEPDFDLARTGGLDVAVDTAFSTAHRLSTRLRGSSTCPAG